MHLIFERSKGKFSSNCNILALAWMPYYNESKFRQALFDYHQRQLMNLTSSIATNNSLNDALNNRRGTPRVNNDHPAALVPDRAQSSTASNTNEQIQNNLGQRQRTDGIVELFLNSRIAELYQRYICLNGLLNPPNRNNLNNTNSSIDINNNISQPRMRKSCSGSSITSALDSRYGRMSEFGWLVVGNVGKIVGITLTSIIQPAKESNEEQSKKQQSSGEDEDLMIFNDDDELAPPEPATNEARAASGADNNPTISASCYVQNSLSSSSSLYSSEFEQIRPDRKSMRRNYNLRGHLDEVILVKWNELYQKLATIDSKGNVLIWCKINEKFTIQTPFYNRTKSVADFKWSNDGKTALICYTDSFILVGSSSGQRHWHSMLNLDDYHITCASWTPNDEQLLLGVSNGNIVVIDLPKSELTELVVNQTNIRAMCWSSCEMNLRNVCNYVYQLDNKQLELDDLFSGKNLHIGNQLQQQQKSTRIPSTIVNQRRLDRDCSVFSRIRFCIPPPSVAPNRVESSVITATPRTSSIEGTCKLDGDTTATSVSVEKLEECENPMASAHRNILAIDFANNTIKLYDGSLDDPEPRTIHTNLESYLMQWSSDGKVLAVAGFNIHTTAPSIGCLRSRYLNSLKFYNHNGHLIYEHLLNYTRYPITAFTWAHEDKRIFVATGPRLHCAKVFFGIAPLRLLAASCLQRHTKLPDKNELLELIVKRDIFTQTRFHNFDATLSSWQSENCPIVLNENDIVNEHDNQHLTHNKMMLAASKYNTASHKKYVDKQKKSHKNYLNNANVIQVQLPFKVQVRLDELFAQTIRQPFDEQLSASDIIWHVPKYQQRYYCTLVCYTSEREISTTGYQQQNYNQQSRNHLLLNNDVNQSSDQYKIFVLYIEFEGSLVPILRARRVGFLKPEFVIFDPDENQLFRSSISQAQQYRRQQQKVSDLSSVRQPGSSNLTSNDPNAFLPNLIKSSNQPEHMIKTNQHHHDHLATIQRRQTTFTNTSDVPMMRNQASVAVAGGMETAAVISGAAAGGSSSMSSTDFYSNNQNPILFPATNQDLNCSDLHLYSSEQRASISSSIGRQSTVSDAENYYNFECDTMNRRQTQAAAEKRAAELISDRSHHQEPIALPLSANPYFLYHMMSNLAHASPAHATNISSNLTHPFNNLTPSSIKLARVLSTAAANNSSSSSRSARTLQQKHLRATIGSGVEASFSGEAAYRKASASNSSSKHHPSRHQRKTNNLMLNSTRNNLLTENNELIRIQSNIWGTKFKLINATNSMIKQRFVLGTVVYKASILHLQPRQIFLNIKDMSNYCCLCSRHHHEINTSHSKRNNRKQQAKLVEGKSQLQSNKANIIERENRGNINHHSSLLDFPTVEHLAQKRQHPCKEQKFSSHKSNQSSSLTHKKTQLNKAQPSSSLSVSKHQAINLRKEEKVILPVGDVIRIAPKLEYNQEYRTQQSKSKIKSSQERALILSSGGRRSLEEKTKIRLDNNISNSEIHKRSKPHHPRLDGVLHSSISSSVHSPLSPSTSRAGYVESPRGEIDENNCEDKNLTRQRLKLDFLSNTSTSDKIRSTTHSKKRHHEFNKNSNTSSRSQDSLNDDDDFNDLEDNDDVLTLSLSQGDKVKVEMSSLKSLNMNNQMSTEHEDTVANESSMSYFLATNKTLKSIQTITKMIVDLSSKAAAQDDEHERKESKLSSPSKLIKPSPPESTFHDAPSSSCYVAPDTPVHRPRKLISRVAKSGLGYSEPFAQTQSANTTPVRAYKSYRKTSEFSRKTTRRRELLNANHNLLNTPSRTDPLNSPLPPPPPSMPMSRKLSSSAKRFIDGSLRSLYEATGLTGGGFHSSDAEPEEHEPLVNSMATRKKSLQREIKRQSSSQDYQSQPSSPMKTLRKQTSELTCSLRMQLIHKLRGYPTFKSSTLVTHAQNVQKTNCSLSSDQLDNVTANRRIISGKEKVKNSNNMQEDDSSLSGSSNDNNSNYLGSSSEESYEVDSTLDSSSDEELYADDSDADNREYLKASKTKSMKDLRNFSKSKSATPKRENSRINKKSANISGREQQQELKKSTKRQSQRNHRRKSICLNPRCSCAREFKLNNRPPVWNELSQIYQLDFGGRVTQESAKNLQIDFEGNLALQFGRIDRCTYTLDYKYPFNAVQAMAVALASLTQRLK